jgi:hypothetical protein
MTPTFTSRQFRLEPIRERSGEADEFDCVSDGLDEIDEARIWGGIHFLRADSKAP